jgi:hypothetical protein
MTSRCAFFVALTFVCNVQLIAAADDPEVFISSRNGPDFKWVWQVKHSRMSSLPKWEEFAGEAPVSPHKAIIVAREFVRERLGIYTPHIIAVSLSPWDHGIWAYHVLFDSEKVHAQEEPLLDVMVLMDGKVVVPVKQSVK